MTTRNIFDRSAALVRGGGNLELSNATKLRLYGLYKHVTLGPCPDQIPPLFATEARAKYQAWLSCKCMTEREAISAYIELAASKNSGFQQLLREFHDSHDKTDEETKLHTNHESDSISSPQESEPIAAPPKRSTSQILRPISFLETVLSYLGVKPIFPRGQLEISFSDLRFAAARCLSSDTTMTRYLQEEKEIVNVWKSCSSDPDVLVGLSVRSLFDLYLRCKVYPSQSEVIVVPPINIPGMMDILKYHGLKIIGVDLPDYEGKNPVIRVDINGVRAAITDKTVAIMVIHPFGIISTTEDEMEELLVLARGRNIDLIEDCAECFTGLGPTAYRGSKHADLSLFSFGTIKTSTALGGGIGTIRDTHIFDQMKRKYLHMYPQQKQSSFFQKIILVGIIKSIAGSPLLYGFLYTFLNVFLGVDVDKLVSSLTRSFLVNTKNTSKVCDNNAQSVLIHQIRFRPCPALLALLNRRLVESKLRAPSWNEKLKRCNRIQTMIAESVSIQIGVPTPSVESLNTYWLYPVLVEDPVATSRDLLYKCFDAPRGLSQLRTIDSEILCPNAEKIMSSVLYLPISHPQLSKTYMQNLIIALERSTTMNKSTELSLSGKSYTMSKTFLSVALICSYVARCVIKQHSFGASVIGIISDLAVLLLIGTGISIAFGVGLRWVMADFYVNTSNSFAKYCTLIDKCSSQSISHPKLLDMSTHMSGGPNEYPIDPTSVLITGATGFVGSSLLYHLLTRRQNQAFTGFIVLLCRPKHGKNGFERISELLNDPIFSFISEEEKQLFIKVVEGDVTKAKAGLSETDLICISEKWNVTRVFHCAASVSFTQSLEDSASANITPSLVLQSFTKQLENVEAKYIHISTAFVHGSETGTPDDPLSEKLFSLGQYDAMEIYRSMTGTQFYAESAMEELGFPNTYTFSKCICEHLLLSEDRGETLIIRPSIVGPALCEPYEGWAGEKPSTIVAAVCLQLKSQWNIWCMGDQNVPYIPVDVAVQFIISKAFDDTFKRKCEVDNNSLASSEESYETISRYELLSCATTDEKSLSRSSSLSLPELKECRIFNATWDVDSSRGAQFTWREFAVSVNHVGTVLGYFSRFTAYIVLVIATKVLPSLKLKRRHSKLLHTCFVTFPMSSLLAICDSFNYKPQLIGDLEKLQPFVDLPILFFPFTSQTFCFRSEISAPESVMGDRYLFTCLVAAHNFILGEQKGKPSNVANPRISMQTVSVAGKACPQKSMDLWWALLQPKGNFFIRIAGYFLIKLFRATCIDVTVDVASFTRLQQELKSGRKREHVVLAPTHRSMFDFLLISFVAFALPELHIEIPYIVAASEFAKLPIIGWFASRAHAIFIKRGGRQLPMLVETVRQLKREDECIEVFIEGTRSRDRRFAVPKTGFLRCLVETGGNHLIVPICINYEKLPEQGVFASEELNSKLNTDGLFTWLCQAFFGKICIGKIHISASNPIPFGDECSTPINFQDLAGQIQNGQKQGILLSQFHISAAAQALNVDESVITRATSVCGCKRWPKTNHSMDITLSEQEKESSAQLWSIMLHFGHIFSPALSVSHPLWSAWLDPSGVRDHSESNIRKDKDVTLVANAMIKIFDDADAMTTLTIERLNQKGFCTPKLSHILQFAMSESREKMRTPIFVMRRAIETRINVVSESHKVEPIQSKNTRLKGLEDKKVDGSQALGKWGYIDCKFVLQTDGKGAIGVVMKGSRNSLNGRSLKKLIPFIEHETNSHFDPLNERALDVTTLLCSPSDLDVHQIEKVMTSVFKCSIAPIDRLHHGTSQAQEDIFLLRAGISSAVRVPDLVAWPSSEEQVKDLVSLSHKHGWCLIPFGGGTNVSQATRCPSKEQEPRPIISVDMKLMNQIIWINEEDGLAHIEAGITGKLLVDEMRKKGYCIGHEPDSLEFSTLGGWIATKASGMKRGKYGNIEEIVKEVKVVGSGGLLATDNKSVGRSAIGLELVSLFLGSEGCLGIITSATIKIWPLPEITEFDSVIFPDLGQGILFARDVAKLGPHAPASVRLLDNDHFRLGQALHAERSLLETAVLQISMRLSPGLQIASKLSAVCATILFEGTLEEVRDQKKRMRQIVVKHGGAQVGPRIGRAGYELTFSIAYLRDFALTYNFLGDSFETFAPWSKLDIIIAATKERIRKEHLERCLPGTPFIASRVTQLYHEGVCVYFYMCMNIEGVERPSDLLTEIEHAARKVILEHGGSLTHHHGIGKIRAPFLDRIYSERYRATLASVKTSIDPENLFGARNGIFS